MAEAEVEVREGNAERIGGEGARLVEVLERAVPVDPSLVAQFLRLAELLSRAREDSTTGAITLHLDSGVLRKIKKEEWEKLA